MRKRLVVLCLIVLVAASIPVAAQVDRGSYYSPPAPTAAPDLWSPLPTPTARPPMISPLATPTVAADPIVISPTATAVPR